MINVENKTKPAIYLSHSNSLDSSNIKNTPNHSTPVTDLRPQQSHVNPASQAKLLKKGQKTSLTKICPTLKNVEIELGWKANSGYDINAEAFLLNSQEKIISEEWLVFYNQEVSPDNSVKIQSKSFANKEIIHINLSKVSSSVNKILIVLTIDEALQKNQNFSHISNAYIILRNIQSNLELIRFDLTEYYKEVTSMMVGELYQKDNEWRFNPIGNGTNDDLLGLCIRYGIEVK